MQTNKKLEGDIIGLEKYKHVFDPVIHKSDLDKAFKEQLKDVVRKSDLDKALVDVVRYKDLDRILNAMETRINANINVLRSDLVGLINSKFVKQ